MFQAHQGDVFIEEVEKIPQTAYPKGDRIVAEGESHNHRHELTDGILLYNLERQEDGFNKQIMYLRVDGEDTTLAHVTKDPTDRPDHDPIAIPTGNYKITLQRRYSPQHHSPIRMSD